MESRVCMAVFENRHRSLIPQLPLLPLFSFPTISFVVVVARLFFPLCRRSRHHLWSLSLLSSLTVNRRRSLSSFLRHRHRSPPSSSLLVAMPSSLKPTTSLIFSLHALCSPAPSPLCSTSSLFSPSLFPSLSLFLVRQTSSLLCPSLSSSLSLSCLPTSRLLFPSSPLPSSPSSTSPLPWLSSATLFLLGFLPFGDLGIRKGVQILCHLQTANPISPLTSLLSLSFVAATTTVGPGPSSIAAFSISSVVVAVTSPSTSSLLASVLCCYPCFLSSSP